MAKAIAICICKECGSTFEKTAFKNNRSEANSWEEWAKETFTQCPQCWGKEQRRKEQEKPLTLNIELFPYNTEKPIVLYFDGNTMPYKDSIKSLNYKWSDKPVTGTFGLLDIKQSSKCWSKVISIDKLDAEVKAVESIGAKINNNINPMDLIAYKQVKAEADKKAEKIAQIEKPLRPAVLSEGKKWNGKVYGKSGKYCVYLDNEKVDITDNQKEEIEKYLRDMEEYKKQIAELEQTL